MSRAAEAWAWDRRPGSPGDKLILLALARVADDAGHCAPSASTLAALTGLTVASVRSGMKRLEQAGLVTRTRRSTDKGFDLPTAVSLNLEPAP